MNTGINTKEYFDKIKEICKKENIEILGNGSEINDSYITFNYFDSSFFDHLFSLRDMEYVFNFEYEENRCLLTVSGDDSLYEDILKVMKEDVKKYSDIDEILNFMDKTRVIDLDFISYYNGVSYFYEISKSKYDFAFNYHDFFFDGNRYHYQVRSYEAFYEILSEINKEIDVFHRFIKEVDFLLNRGNYEKNTYIQFLREVFSKNGDKSLFLIYWDYSYYVGIKINDNLSVYKYDNGMYFKNMIPELLELYLDNTKGEYIENRNYCLGRSFYKSKDSLNNELYFYNIDDEEMDSYLAYLQVMLKEMNKNNEYSQDVINVDEKNNSSKGYINILILSVGVVVFSIFIFLMTLNFIK